MGRGVVTSEIKAKAKELLDIKDLSEDEFRLMPYVQYVVVNNKFIDQRKINDKERAIIQRWRNQGWISGVGVVQMEKKFWDAIHELIWLGYANP